MAGHPLMGTMEVKSVRTFPVILVKLVTPPLPPQTKLILSTMGGNECFFGPQHCRGGGSGERWDESKVDQKIVIRSRVTIILCNRLFHTVPSSLVSHCSPCFKVVCDNPE